MSLHRSFRRAILATACGIGFLCVGSAAEASTIWVRNASGGVFGSNGSVNLSIKVDGTNKSVAAGTFALQYSTTSSGGPWTNFLTYCLEPDELLAPSGNPNLTTPVQGTLNGTLGGTAEYSADATALAQLYNAFYADSLTSATNGAAFQVALWEIAYDSGDDLGNGAFRLNTSGAVKTRAQYYLANYAIMGSATPEPGVILRIGNQDLLIQVPEPATLGLLGAGLVGLGLAARRRRKTA